GQVRAETWRYRACGIRHAPARRDESWIAVCVVFPRYLREAGWRRRRPRDYIFERRGGIALHAAQRPTKMHLFVDRQSVCHIVVYVDAGLAVLVPEAASTRDELPRIAAVVRRHRHGIATRKDSAGNWRRRRGIAGWREVLPAE